MVIIGAELDRPLGFSLVVVKRHNNLFFRRLLKYIGFDIDCKKVVACVVENCKQDIYQTLGPDISSMRRFLLGQKRSGDRIELAFEISGEAGFIYDSLLDYVDQIHVVNPYKATWIFRTAKKNDRIDARKMAVLLSIGELPTVYMPSREVRQWRQTILHRKKLVGKAVRAKNRIRAVLKSHGHSKSAHGGGWWKKANRLWMRSFCEVRFNAGELWHMQLCDLLDELDLAEKQLNSVTDRLNVYHSKKPGGRLLMSLVRLQKGCF